MYECEQQAFGDDTASFEIWAMRIFLHRPEFALYTIYTESILWQQY